MVAERLVRLSERLSHPNTVQRAAVARSSSPAAERDRRSLRVQIEEDDDVIEIETGELTDHGIGMTNVLEETDSDRNQQVGFSPGPGKGRGSVAPACRATDDPDIKLNEETKIPNESTDEESVPQTPHGNTGTPGCRKGSGYRPSPYFSTVRSSVPL